MILGSGGEGNIAGVPILGPAGAIDWAADNSGVGTEMFWLAGKSTYGGQ